MRMLELIVTANPKRDRIVSIYEREVKKLVRNHGLSSTSYDTYSRMPDMDRSKLYAIEGIHLRLVSSLILHDHVLDFLINILELPVRRWRSRGAFSRRHLSLARDRRQPEFPTKLVCSSEGSPSLRQHAQQISAGEISHEWLGEFDWWARCDVEPVNCCEVTAKEERMGHDSSWKIVAISTCDHNG